MVNVQVVPSRDLRNKYAEISKHVKENNPVIITNNGKGDTVLISMEEYTKFEDYIQHRYILEELAKAEEEAADKETKWFSHDEVWSEIMSRRNKKDV